MSSRKRLELTWIGKESRPRLEPRILLENPDRSYHASHQFTDRDIFDNLLIHGDNLLALKALEQEFTGKVKCVFIDPPYNTGNAFEHYDDGLEHSTWLSMMLHRLELLRKILSEDGSIWVTVDDHEAHYLKVLMDEVFGRSNFIANCVWQKKYSSSNDHKSIAPMHDHLLVYRKSEKWRRNLMPRKKEKDKQYKFSDDRGVYRISDYTCSKTANERPNLYYPIKHPISGKSVLPKKTRVWAYSEEEYNRHLREGLIVWGASGKANAPGFKRYRDSLKNDGVIPNTWWTFDIAGHTDGARKELRSVLRLGSLADDFITPKPEALVSLVIQIATNPGDIVLDSFLGSGTTAAVAHKMGRRWIGIELGDHCHTHCLPRLKKVVDGEDLGGITDSVGWRGGGGFRYYNLGASLLLRDKWNQLIINPAFNAPMLAEAVCKLEGFSYAPSDTLYWQQGHSTERDFIYITTASLTHEQLQQLSDEVGTDRTLLIVCSSFRGRGEGYSNLTLKKIPKAVLGRCEWGKDDYSLKVGNLPNAPSKVG
jgi:adenine-specific DNA-methyltransferase